MESAPRHLFHCSVPSEFIHAALFIRWDLKLAVAGFLLLIYLFFSGAGGRGLDANSWIQQDENLNLGASESVSQRSLDFRAVCNTNGPAPPS